MKPNEDFKLSVRDIDIIEHALRDRMHKVSMHRMTLIGNTIKGKEEIESIQLADQELNELHDLLAKLHDQKIWYRPAGQYVGG